jgi:hypothetical protein
VLDHPTETQKLETSVQAVLVRDMTEEVILESSVRKDLSRELGLRERWIRITSPAADRSGAMRVMPGL